MQQSLELGKFNKVDERTNPESLPNTSLQSLQNMVLDNPLGVASLRQGFSRWNTSAGQVIGTGGVISKMYDLIDQNLNNAIYASVQDATHGQSINKSIYTGSLSKWLPIRNGLSTSANKMRLANYAGKFLISNGYDAPFYTDNSDISISGGSLVTGQIYIIDSYEVGDDFSNVANVLSGTINTTGCVFKATGTTPTNYINNSVLRSANSWNMALAQPNVDLVDINPSVPAGVLTGVYRYALVYILNNGQKTNVSQIMSFYDGGVEYYISSLQYILTNLPVSSDSRVVSKLLFRTKANILDKFYLLTTLDNAATSYTDNTADANLDSTETIQYLNTPNTVKYLTTQSDIIFLANINKTYTNRVIPPPHVNSNLVTSLSAGSVPIGTYNYAYSFVDVNGNESTLTNLAQAVITGSAQEVTLFNFGFPFLTMTTGSAVLTFDTSIKLIRFYRTKELGAHPTSPYYFLQEAFPWSYSSSAPAGNVILDNALDSTLTIAYPKSDNGVTPALNGGLDTITLNSTVIFSNPFNYLEYPELNLIEVYPDDGDSITGIFDDDNGIIIFKQKSICKLYTNGDSSNWQAVKLSENIGCDQPDSIYKLGGNYFFVFRNRPYLFAGQGEPKELGLFFNKTFDSVTSFLGVTYYTKNEWFVLTVKVGSSPYLLCYDMKLETWYKFTINEADTLMIKDFGADAGKLLIGGGSQYINFYDYSVFYDTVLDGVTKTPPTTFLTTKNFSFSDNFNLARLRFLFIDYIRLNCSNFGVAAQSAQITITDVSTGTTLVYNDTTDGTGLTSLRQAKTITDNLGSLTVSKKLYITFGGQAISQLNELRIDYRSIRRGQAISQ